MTNTGRPTSSRRGSKNRPGGASSVSVQKAALRAAGDILKQRRRNLEELKHRLEDGSYKVPQKELVAALVARLGQPN